MIGNEREYRIAAAAMLGLRFEELQERVAAFNL